jgi:UPF0755 protein
MLLTFHVSRLRYRYGAILLGLAIVSLLLWYFLFLPVKGFPTGVPITIESGASVRHAASELREGGYIRSTWLFRVLYRLMPDTHGVQSGKYVFMEPVGEYTVAWNLAHGVAGVPTVRVTFPEGTTARQMGAALERALPAFDEDKFDTAAIPAEGYLFPDTYFFLPGTTESEAVEILRANYTKRIAKYLDQIATSGHSEREILTMASLLEGEGKTLEDRRMIAGILWKRMSIGMPLQVDASFGYIYGKTGYVPTGADLKGNSAYNTYRYKGLPPTPINNPGDVAILAALTPTKSEYFYYITGDDGKMYYAKTLEGHVVNQRKYIK